MLRHRLSDEQWELIEGLFPAPAKTGRPPVDRRMVVDGIFWILRTGAPWRDLPPEFGKWQTAWDLFDKWNASGIWDRVLKRLQVVFVDAKQINDELWCIDGSVVRAARCAGGGEKKVTSSNLQTTH
jgi:transposase